MARAWTSFSIFAVHARAPQSHRIIGEYKSTGSLGDRSQPVLSRLTSGKIRIPEPIRQNPTLNVQGEWCTHTGKIYCHSAEGQSWSQTIGEVGACRLPEKVNRPP